MKSDFNGNGSSDIMISSPWGLAILNLSSNTLLPSTIAPNGTRFGSWLLNTSDNNFGPNGDFDGDGKTEVLASSPWGIGVLKQSGNTFTSPVKESRYFCDSLFWASQPKQAAKDYATVILLRKPRYPWHNIVPTQQGDRDIVPIVDAAYR